jgi:hypothetical protein
MTHANPDADILDLLPASSLESLDKLIAGFRVETEKLASDPMPRTLERVNKWHKTALAILLPALILEENPSRTAQAQKDFFEISAKAIQGGKSVSLINHEPAYTQEWKDSTIENMRRRTKALEIRDTQGEEPFFQFMLGELKTGIDSWEERSKQRAAGKVAAAQK